MLECIYDKISDIDKDHSKLTHLIQCDRLDPVYFIYMCRDIPIITFILETCPNCIEEVIVDALFNGRSDLMNLILDKKFIDMDTASRLINENLITCIDSYENDWINLFTSHNIQIEQDAFNNTNYNNVSSDVGSLAYLKACHKHGIDINIQSIFLSCCEYALFESISYLIDNGMDIHINDDVAFANCGIKMFKYSHYNCKPHSKSLKLLLENGAIVSAHENRQLILNITVCNVENVKLLQIYGADINAINNIPIIFTPEQARMIDILENYHVDKTLLIHILTTKN